MAIENVFSRLKLGAQKTTNILVLPNDVSIISFRSDYMDDLIQPSLQRHVTRPMDVLARSLKRTAGTTDNTTT